MSGCLAPARFFRYTAAEKDPISEVPEVPNPEADALEGLRFVDKGDLSRLYYTIFLGVFQFRSILLPRFIFIGRILYTFSIQIGNHLVELALPHFFEPLGMSEPLNKGGADCIIGADEYSTVPRFRKSIVAESTKCPNLGQL